MVNRLVNLLVSVRGVSDSSCSGLRKLAGQRMRARVEEEGRVGEAEQQANELCEALEQVRVEPKPSGS